MHTMEDVEDRFRRLESAVAPVLRYYRTERKRLMQEINDLNAAVTRYKAAVDARETKEEAVVADLQAHQLSDADKAALVQSTQIANDAAAAIEAQNAAAGSVPDPAATIGA